MTTTTLTVAEIQQAGVTIEPHEAVAIAQQLIDALRDRGGTCVLEPPYGPPSAGNVLLKGDGTVLCRRCGTTPAILEVAILAQLELGLNVLQTGSHFFVAAFKTKVLLR